MKECSRLNVSNNTSGFWRTNVVAKEIAAEARGIRSLTSLKHFYQLNKSPRKERLGAMVSKSKTIHTIASLLKEIRRRLKGSTAPEFGRGEGKVQA